MKKNITFLIIIINIFFSFSQNNVEYFIKHKVKKKETIFSLSTKYNISIDVIKKFNPIIKNNDLKKKMIVNIPVFNDAYSGKIKNKENYLVDYKIPIKDTKWRIAYKYGITIDSLEVLNPKIRDGLIAGQVIKVPKIDSTTKNVETEYYYYKVKFNDDLESLIKKTELSKDELYLLNPFLKNQIIEDGMILKTSKYNFKKLKSVNNFLIEKTDLKDSVFKVSKIKLAVFLPFKFNELELDSIQKMKEILSKRNLHTISLDFYSGILMASQKAADYGLSTELQFIDTQNDKNHIREVLNQNSINDIDAIIGPLIPSNFNFVYSSEKFKGIPMIAPLSSKPVIKGQNIYQSVSSFNFLREKMINYLEKKIDSTSNTLIIADSLNRSTEKILFSKFPYAKLLRPEIGDYMSTELVDSLVIDSLPNKVIFESQNLSLIANVTSLLNSLVSNERKIQLFSTYRSNFYDNINISRKHLGNIKFSFASGSIIRENNESKEFENKFFEKFNNLPSKESKRAYDLTLDLILRFAFSKSISNKLIGETEYLENRFNYISDNKGGYENQGYYLLEHEGYLINEINK